LGLFSPGKGPVQKGQPCPSTILSGWGISKKE
jgi:hypothetical protein